VTGTTTIVQVGPQVFYVAKISFESRALAGGEAFAPTSGTLELPATTTTFTRSAVVDGRSARFATGSPQFTYSAGQQGLIERIDLTVAETYAEWSNRIFGAYADPNADPDGDGTTNYQEYLAGTDPKNAASRFGAVGFNVEPNGDFTISWSSILDRNYQVQRSTDLAPNSWTFVSPVKPGTGAMLTHTDTPPPQATRVFYRIMVMP
jgi:hypothetical protein